MNTFNGKNTVVFLDFDNTITTRDVFDDMLLRFSKDESWKDLEERWKNKEIGSRQCLEGQIKSISVAKKALDEYLGRIELDPYFKRLIGLLRARRIKTIVLSDNFDYILNRILKKNGIHNLKVYSNKAELVGDRLIPGFPFTDNRCRVCAHCKKKNLLSNVNGHSMTIYVGDGQSDICPAKYVKKVFAKEGLLDYFRKEGLSHIPYKNLKEVYNYLKKEYKNEQN
ncbi:MAG: MtnX-like HAD-IB family phosphatase [Candidatus Omnitrophica bacterium]|nr:MtnX-like HAD-IB family phosphatase [Candidatus Omnitrophota bacterium]